MERSQETWLRLEELILTRVTIIVTLVFFITVLTLMIKSSAV